MLRGSRISGARALGGHHHEHSQGHDHSHAGHSHGGHGHSHAPASFDRAFAIGIGLNSAPLWLSRYAFGLEVPHVSLATQEIADFVSGPVIGTMIAMVFRYWAMARWVFVQRAEV